MPSKEIIKIVTDIKNLFIDRSLTISVAESCTGGLICHYLTMIPGASNFFMGGIVAYSLESKRILGVSEETIKNYGVISPDTAREMAERVRELFKTDISISTTGNIGPDAIENKEVGLIYIGISDKERTTIKTLRLKGNRLKNKEEAAYFSLKYLLKNLLFTH